MSNKQLLTRAIRMLIAGILLIVSLRAALGALGVQPGSRSAPKSPAAKSLKAKLFARLP